ncbi:MAG TPA: signal peptide peptidase SppA, partial [Candidatus Latescibacteria bacterium]|nr:signal peptide peptidase SppA [Candidatus Latescibacterota bacterium]
MDSPGGAYSAADAIWRATRLAQESSVPVIVSMSSVAASGGYLISTHADHVIAQPGTITGSIGVWGGKFVMRDMWRKIGVTFDSVHFGPQARFSSTLTDFSESERMRFEAQLDRVYDAFVAQVSDGRNLLRQKVSALAQGKVWTGQQAQEVGLVDEIGGYAAAIEAARVLLGLAPDTDIQFVIYPK